METVLIVVHLLVVIALCAVVLLQRSEGGGLGSGANPSAFLTGRGQANLLTRITAILGTAFFVLSLGLAVLAARGRSATSPLDKAAKSVESPVSPTLPAGSGNVLEELQRLQGNKPQP